MARMKAPAGGIITNDTFQQGGRFLPRALGKIRDVVARKRAKKLARAGQRPFKLARPGPDPVDVTIKAPEGVADRALTLDELKQIENSFQLPEKHRLSSKVIPKVKKGKRVFEAAVQVGKNGQIQVKTNHVAQFFDAIHKTLVPDRRSLRRVLNGPYSDPVKTAHLVLNLGADLDRAGKESGGSGGINWYTDKIREFDDLTRAYLGRPLLDDATHARVRDAIAAGRHADVPGIIRGTGGADLPESTHGLFKALLAFTSGAQNPVANTAVATKMYRAGQRAAPAGADPLLHIPEYNHEDLANWLAASKVAPPPTNPDELVRWVLHHGAEPHYKTREVQYVHRPGHDDHGKALKYQAAEPQYDENDEVVPGTSKKRWVPFGDAKTIDSLYRKHSGHVKKLAVPILSESGALQPKNWTVRGEAVVRALDRFKRIIKHVGGDHGKALTWLMAEHPIEEITKVTGAEPDAGYYPAGTKTIPGAFTFGPKFGPFFLNLLIPDHPELAKHLTADMWWARTWQRYLGRTYGKKKVASGPTSSAERRAMWEAAKTVAGKHGLTVAALQAALWYHEQNLWRLFGAKNASYDYSHGIRDAIKKKLSRADLRPFHASLQEGRGVNTPADRAALGAIADYLAEHGDPREDLVRPTAEHGEQHDKRNESVKRSDFHETGRMVGARHTFPDGTLLDLDTFGRNKQIHHLYFDVDPGGYHPMPLTFMEPAELHAWLARFPEEERAKMYKNLKLQAPK